MMKAFLALSFGLFFWPNLGTACSAIVIKDKNTILLAKNFDWTYGSGYVIKNLRAVPKRAFVTQAGQSVSWVSQYGSITFNQNGKEFPYGGINERGLTIEMLWQEFTDYGNATDQPYLNELEWIQYQLDNYSSVAEVVDHLAALTIRPLKGKIHYLVADPSGHSVVIDFINGKAVVTPKEADECQAITNYAAQMSQANYERQPPALKGKNTSHLHRYYVLQRKIDEQQFQQASAAQGFNALKAVTIAKGHFKTYWSIVYDLKVKTVQFKSLAHNKIKTIDLSQLDFTTQTSGIDINAQLKGDVSQQLQPFTKALNSQLIQTSFANLGLGQVNAAELSDHQFNFSSKPDNTYMQHYASLRLTFNTTEAKLGNIVFAIMEGESNFVTQKPIEGGANGFNVALPTYQWVYYGLPKGAYAIAVLQDSNNNKRLDLDAEGNPTEKYAFSQAARMANGQYPAYQDCVVECQDNLNSIVLSIE